MTKILFIDHREKSGLEALIQKYCDKKSLHYQVRENLITDYAFGSVGIEAKSVPDFMGSLFSGRLERQLQNLDDNYNQMVLIVWGTIDNYISQARRGGKKIQFATAWNTYIGALARFSTDYDINVLTFPDKSSAARFICKRFEKHGTMGRSSTYRMMRKTASEDRRIDILKAAGCSEIIAKRLLKEFGSIAEMIEMTAKELQVVEGVGKVRANRILVCLNSEEPVEDQRIRMTHA